MKITDVINEMVSAFGFDDPKDINEGWCADFAHKVGEKVPGSSIRCDEDFGREYTHTFLKYRGRYYDAEAPLGVKNWKQLPYFKRQTKRWKALLSNIGGWTLVNGSPRILPR